MNLPPIRRQVVVPAAAEVAFDPFTADVVVDPPPRTR
jgi:hypothetical protein